MSTEEGLEQAAGLGLVGGAVNRGGSVYPDPSVFLYEWISGGNRVGDCFAGGAFCSGRGEVADHGALVVGEGLEMTVVGAVEGAVTYVIGILLGKGGM